MKMVIVSPRTGSKHFGSTKLSGFRHKLPKSWVILIDLPSVNLIDVDAHAKIVTGSLRMTSTGQRCHPKAVIVTESLHPLQQREREIDPTSGSVLIRRPFGLATHRRVGDVRAGIGTVVATTHLHREKTDAAIQVFVPKFLTKSSAPLLVSKRRLGGDIGVHWWVGRVLATRAGRGRWSPRRDARLGWSDSRRHNMILRESRTNVDLKLLTN